MIAIASSSPQSGQPITFLLPLNIRGVAGVRIGIRMAARIIGRTLLFVIALATLAAAQNSDSTAWKILRDGCASHSPDDRTAAILALALLPNSADATALAEKALDDEKPLVRAAGAASLGKMLSTPSIPKLEKKLSDKEPVVALAAARSLIQLKDSAGYELYYAVLTGARKGSKGMVSEQMDTFKDPKKLALFSFEEGLGFLPFAGYGMGAFKALTHDDKSPVRSAAATLLANDPDPQAGEALSHAAADASWQVRAAALDAIAKRGDPRLITAVEPAFTDKKAAVKYTAAAAYLRLSSSVHPGKVQ